MQADEENHCLPGVQQPTRCTKQSFCATSMTKFPRFFRSRSLAIQKKKILKMWYTFSYLYRTSTFFFSFSVRNPSLVLLVVLCHRTFFLLKCYFCFSSFFSLSFSNFFLCFLSFRFLHDLSHSLFSFCWLSLYISICRTGRTRRIQGGLAARSWE